MGDKKGVKGKENEWKDMKEMEKGGKTKRSFLG